MALRCDTIDRETGADGTVATVYQMHLCTLRSERLWFEVEVQARSGFGYRVEFVTRREALEFVSQALRAGGVR